MRILIASLLLAIPLSGCNRPTTVQGDVLYDGQELPNGFISFFPAEGGSSVGAAIVNGRYLIEEATPGKNRVLITTHPLALVTKYKSGERPLLHVRHVEQIPPDAPGNNQIVDVQAGAQTIDFQVRSSR